MYKLFIIFEIGGSTIHCCKGTKCINLEVIDGGPACYVETEVIYKLYFTFFFTLKINIRNSI